MAEERPEPPGRRSERDRRTQGSAAAARAAHQASWVDQQIRIAMERGDFDNLPGAGKPLKDLGSQHDPDWWLKKLIEREQVSGVLPPALALRKEDAELGATLDREWSEDEVRRQLEDFNRRVIEARRQLQGGPPVITKLRDVDAEVRAWRERKRR
ncbi:MAG: DUF1992 domain-containing protein [Marmoricola sp.]